MIYSWKQQKEIWLFKTLFCKYIYLNVYKKEKKKNIVSVVRSAQTQSKNYTTIKKNIEQNNTLDIDCNGKIITLQREDVEITSQDIEGWLVANEGKITVALDVTITEPLREEGIARELVNRIQNLRKDSGFEVTDRITVQLQEDQNITQAVNNNLDYIKTETLTDNLEIINQIDNGIEIAFDDVNTKLSIQKN